MEGNAGARVEPATLSRALAAGMKIEDFLARNDAYGYFSALDDLVMTGPTFTNVNDFRALLVL
jgi:hydroxypyruvate reductase